MHSITPTPDRHAPTPTSTHLRALGRPQGRRTLVRAYPISDTSTIKYLKITLGSPEPGSNVSNYYNKIGALATYLLAIGGRHCEYDLELAIGDWHCEYDLELDTDSDETDKDDTIASFYEATLRGTLCNIIARRIAETPKPAGWRKLIKAAEGESGAGGASAQ